MGDGEMGPMWAKVRSGSADEDNGALFMVGDAHARTSVVLTQIIEDDELLFPRAFFLRGEHPLYRLAFAVEEHLPWVFFSHKATTLHLFNG